MERSERRGRRRKRGKRIRNGSTETGEEEADENEPEYGDGRR